MANGFVPDQVITHRTSVTDVQPHGMDVVLVLRLLNGQLLAAERLVTCPCFRLVGLVV